jgi:hypothetical protein
VLTQVTKETQQLEILLLSFITWFSNLFPNIPIFVGRLVLHSQKVLEGFIEVHLYHSLKGHNNQANAMENQACALLIRKVTKNWGGGGIF